MEAMEQEPAPRTLAATRRPVSLRRPGADANAQAVILAAWEDHARDLHAFARSLVRDPEAAEDLVSEAYLRLVRETYAGRAPDDARAWLYRVTANMVLSRGRRIATARRFLGRLVDHRVGESAESSHARLDLGDDLREALLALPADSRVAIVMSARGATGREIAAAIGRSEAATRTLLTRARQRLRARLEAGSGSWEAGR